MQVSLLMNFAERHRKWLYLAILFIVPLASILFLSGQANAATGINAIFSNDSWKRSPQEFLNNVQNDRCSYLAMCRWGSVMSVPSASALIPLNPLMILGSISSILFMGVAFFASMVLQFILFLSNSSFLGSLSYFVDGVFAHFLQAISADRPLGSSANVFGNAPLMIIVVVGLIAYFVFAYIVTIVRGQPGFGRKLAGGLLSITALLIISYQAMGNHSETANTGNSSAMAKTLNNQASTQANSGRLKADGTPEQTSAKDPTDPKNWNIASPGWFLAWGGQLSSLATDAISATIDTVRQGGDLINGNVTSIGEAGVNGQGSGLTDMCGQYIKNMHSILETKSTASVVGNSSKIATSYDDLLVSFILNPYVISKYGPPSKSMANSWCRDMENRANTPPGLQVLAMAWNGSDMYGVSSGFLFNEGDSAETKRPLVNGYAWASDGWRAAKANGEVVAMDNDKGAGSTKDNMNDNGNGGKYWGSPMYVAARAFSPNLADVAGGGAETPYQDNGLPSSGADIKAAGFNNSRENASRYWFAACLWNSRTHSMNQNPEWNGVMKAKAGVTGATGDTTLLFRNNDAACHSIALIGDNFNSDPSLANATGYLADGFGYREPDDWLNGISKALFGRSMPSVATSRVFANAPGGSAGPASLYYLTSNGFDPTTALPFVVIALVLTVQSFKFIMPLFLGSFISQAIAVLALCISPILLLLSGFGIQFVRSVARKALGMVVTAFLTFSVLIGVIQLAAALADVFRKVLYSPWHPIIFQVVEMGLAGVLAMQAVKMFVANTMNIKTTNMRDAMSSAVGFSTGNQKIGTMFKKPSDANGKTSSGAMDKIRQSAASARDGVINNALGSAFGKFGRNPDLSKKVDPEKATGKANSETLPQRTVPEDALKETGVVGGTKKATAAEKAEATGAVPPATTEEQKAAQAAAFTKPTPDEVLKGASAEEKAAFLKQNPIAGSKAPEGAKGLTKPEDVKNRFKDILDNATVGGFGPEVSQFERHATMGLANNLRPFDIANMSDAERKALAEGRLDQAINGSQGDRVAFASAVKSQDAYTFDPLTNMYVPKGIIESGNMLGGETNQNGVYIDGVTRGANGLWSVQKLVDPSSPAMGVLQGPAPEGFADPQAWKDAGDLHQWMNLQGIDASNMDTSKWPAERQAQFDSFKQNAGSLYTALGANLPTVTSEDLKRNAENTVGFQAPEIPMDGLGSEATAARNAFANMGKELAALETNQEAQIAQIVKDRTAGIVSARKERFEREAGEIQARFDKLQTEDAAKNTQSVFFDSMTQMMDHAKESGASESNLNTLKKYADRLSDSISMGGDDASSEAAANEAIERLAQAFKSSGAGEAKVIERLATQMREKLEDTRRRHVNDRTQQISSLEAKFRSDIDQIQSNARRQAERDTEHLYREVMDKAKEEAFSGNKGSKTRKQAILNWFPSLFESGRE